jgi:hypothetical protein
MVLLIGGKECNITTQTLGKYSSIGKYMIEKTKEILKKEQFPDVPVKIGIDTFYTCGGRLYIQYGSNMILSQINDSFIQAERYYFCVKLPDTQKLVLVSIAGEDKHKIGFSTKLASTMLEEISHVIASGKAGHGEAFYSVYVKVWEKYFELIREELNKELSIILMCSR